MEHFFLNLFEANFTIFKNFGYIIIFLVALVESIPLVGMLIPGQTVIILAGFLVKLKLFGFWFSVGIACIGATFGDLVGYFLGKKYGTKLTLSEKKFFINKDQLLKTKAMIENNPIKTIFFGRLHSLTRTLTPFASGASAIPLSKFLIIDIASSFVWAFISILIGFIFGKSFEKASAFIGSFVLMATFITICIILVVQYAKKKNVVVSNTGVFLFVSSVISIYIFGLITQNLHNGELFSIFDQKVYVLKDLIYSPFLNSFMIFFTKIGNWLPMTIFSIIFAGFLIFKKQKHDVLILTFTLGSGYLVLNALKAYFERIRPLGIIEASGGSFPSGHATMAMIFVTLLTMIVLRHIKNYYIKNSLIIGAYAIAVLIGISRVYLGVHWASDVLAGFFLGIFYVTFIIVSFEAGKFILKITKKEKKLPLP